MYQHTSAFIFLRDSIKNERNFQILTPSIFHRDALVLSDAHTIYTWQLGMLIDQDSKNWFLKIHDVYVLLDNFIPL